MKEKADNEESMNDLCGESGDQEYDHLTHNIGQLKVTEKAKKYLGSLTKKHETESQRIIIQVLGQEGVCIQVYFDGVINGPHCFLLSEHGEWILKEISRLMKDVIKEQRLLAAMNLLEDRMVLIIGWWDKIASFLKSTKRHTDNEINNFEANIDKMRAAINDIIKVNPPLKGDENQLKFWTTLKVWALFAPNGSVMKWTRMWKVTGAFDKESGESSHAKWKLLTRRLGCLRGNAKTQKQFQLFQAGTDPLLWGRVDNMMKDLMAKNDKRRASTQDGGDILDDEEINELTPLSGELRPYKVAMNNSSILRGPSDPEHEHYQLSKEMNRKIFVCPSSGKRILGHAAYQSHCREVQIITVLDVAPETVRATLR